MERKQKVTTGLNDEAKKERRKEGGRGRGKERKGKRERERVAGGQPALARTLRVLCLQICAAFCRGSESVRVAEKFNL